MTRTNVLLGCCAATMIVTSVLAGLSALSVLSGQREVAPSALEHRFAALEAEFAALTSRLPRRVALDAGTLSSSERSESDPDDPDPASSDSPAVERILRRLDEFERRLRALERDPLERGYSFVGSASSELRRRGIRALASIARHDPEARAMIRSLLEDPDSRVRESAIDALADIDDKEAVPLLVQSLSDPDAEVREEAIDALAELDAKHAGMEIAGLLLDPSDDVREEAADVLGRLEFAGSTELLVEALGDTNEDVRGEAIASIGEVGAKNAAPVLRSMYDEDPGRHRWRLVRALRQLGDTEPHQAEIRRLSQIAMKGDDERSRRDAVRELTEHARRDSAELFRSLLDDPSPRVREAAERGLRRR